MKNLFQKFSIVAVAMLFALVATHSASAGTASWANPNNPAYGTIAGLSGTSIVASKVYGSTTYTPTSSANAGDRIAVVIYFHNDGNANATQTRVKLSVPSGSASSFTLNGSVFSGFIGKTGSTTINLSSSQTLSFIPGSLRVGYDRNLNGTSVANEQDIFSNALGLDIGTIPGMNTCGTDPLCHQGYIALGFQVSQAQTQTHQCNNGVDDDGDGRIDMNDSGCSYPTDDSEYNQTSQTYQCNNGYDDDGDGYIDMNDSGCSYTTDDSEYTSSNNNSLYVYTDQYSWINQNTGNVTLNGHYSGNNNYSSDTYFEYRQNNYNNRTVHAGVYYDSNRSFSVSLYNLEQGTYDYRACVNSSSYCGSWLSFNVNSTYYPPINNQQPTVQTLSPIQYDYNFATLDGVYNMNGCSGTTYFEYGPNNNFGYTTPPVSRSGSGSMSQSINGLIPQTTYSYRAVLQNCMGTYRGSTLSFTTTATPTVIPNNPPTVITRTIVNTTNVGGGSRFIRLTIDNGRDTVVRNDELFYDVAWENITKTDLHDLVLEISFPKELQVVGTDRGQIDRAANIVYVNISELKGLEKDDMTVRAKITTNSLKDNDPVTARAIMAFENPTNKAQENAIAYDSDTYLANTNVLGASIFGLGFLPGTLAGWLFIILLLVLLILVIRYLTRREQHNHYYPKDDSQIPPMPMTPMGSTTTTTTDVDYTPYRPTPKN